MTANHAEPGAVGAGGIAYETRGAAEPGAPAVVLVHGLTGDRAMLAESCEPAFAALPGLRRIYLDLPGHGDSPAIARHASADGLVDALAEFIAEQVLPDAAAPLLVGYSYGAYLVQGLLGVSAARGVMLVCPVVEPDHGLRRLPPRHVAVRDEPLLLVDDPHEQEPFDEVAVVRTTEVLERYRRIVCPASRRADRDFVAAIRARYALTRPMSAAFAAFDAPVSIVCGRHDHWVGFEDAATLAGAFPRASLHVLDGCGQLLPIEQPARFAALVHDWLARTGDA